MKMNCSVNFRSGIPCVLFLSIVCLFLSSCFSPKKQSEDFVTKASKYLSEFEKDCGQDQSKTWGRSLCVPMIILDRNTMMAVTSKIDPKSSFEKTNKVWRGKYYGPKVYANTSIKWKGEAWSMVLFPLPKSRESRRELLIHEAWHSVQDDLGLPANNLFLDHLDSYDGRLLIRLEWEALLLALVDESQRKSHIAQALLFRGIRYKKFPKAQIKEKTLDFNEGLAAYTGAKFRNKNIIDLYTHLGETLKKVPEVPSLTRSASYYTGPLYGLLFDTVSNDWKKNLAHENGFGDLARKLFKIPGSKKIALPSKIVLEKYNYANIESFEEPRKIEKDNKIKKYLLRFSQKGSLQIHSSRSAPVMFDPRQIFALSKNEFIYIYYETTDQWGKLKVSDGARVLIGKDKKTIFLAPIKSNENGVATGEGWSIKLNDGWTLKKSGDGFYKPEKK